MKAHKNITFQSLLISLFLSLNTTIALAQDKGFEIAKKSYDKEKGFENYSVHVSMLLSNGKGRVLTRNMVMKVLEVKDDGNKSLMEFENPADVKGTFVLTYTHREGDDDQWLYLPALGRVKRISSSSKSGSFLGSEFAFEDLASPELEKFSFKFLKESTWNALPVCMVERIPLDKNSGYSKQIVYYNKNNYQVEKIDYFDRKGIHVKTLNFEDYNSYNNGLIKPSKLVMQNKKNGKRTSLNYEDYRFKDESIKAMEFTPTGMKGI